LAKLLESSPGHHEFFLLDQYLNPSKGAALFCMFLGLGRSVAGRPNRETRLWRSLRGFHGPSLCRPERQVQMRCRLDAGMVPATAVRIDRCRR
jgi:hypothetical protein